MKRVTIGTLSKEAGVTAQTVRFYERQGLLPKPARTLSGYRDYAPEDARRVSFIKRAQALGFTLEEIKALLSLSRSPRATCEDIRERAEVKITEIDEKIADLKRIRSSLKEVIDACGESKQAAARCRIYDCLAR